MSRTVQISTRVDDETAERLDLLAQATGRSRAYLFHQAINEYIDGEMSFIESVERGKAQAQAGQGRDWQDVKADLQKIIDDAGTR